MSQWRATQGRWADEVMAGCEGQFCFDTAGRGYRGLAGCAEFGEVGKRLAGFWTVIAVFQQEKPRFIVGLG